MRVLKYLFKEMFFEKLIMEKILGYSKEIDQTPFRIIREPDLPTGREFPDFSKNDYKHYSSNANFNLKKMLQQIDSDYFDSYFYEKNILPRVHWWIRGAKYNAKSTIGGMAFLNENTILINFRFNSSTCKEDVIKLLLYHELLHIALWRAGLNPNHTSLFLDLESKFKNFEQVEKQSNHFYKHHVTGKPMGELNRRLPKKVRKIKKSKISLFKTHEDLKHKLQKILDSDLNTSNKEAM